MINVESTLEMDLDKVDIRTTKYILCEQYEFDFSQADLPIKMNNLNASNPGVDISVWWALGLPAIRCEISKSLTKT